MTLKHFQLAGIADPPLASSNRSSTRSPVEVALVVGVEWLQVVGGVLHARHFNLLLDTVHLAETAASV